VAAWGPLVAGVALLVAFVVIQQRASHPLLPLRILLDRNRGGSYLAVFLLTIGMFAVLLFLTFYLQQNLHFTPLQSGVAFLPMLTVLILSANVATSVRLSRVGPRLLVAAGLLLGGAALLWLSAIKTGSTYVGGVLAPLMVMGIGFGVATATAMSVATLGNEERDAGVASAALNTAQQIGGSIGTALLSTLAGSAATAYLVGKNSTPQILAEAAVNSYTTAFAWAGGILIAGAVICGLLLRPGAAAQLGISAPAIHM
jgi:predicted MFS family arabinose efflux permease